MGRNLLVGLNLGQAFGWGQCGGKRSCPWAKLLGLISGHDSSGQLSDLAISHKQFWMHISVLSLFFSYPFLLTAFANPALPWSCRVLLYILFKLFTDLSSCN